MNLNETELDSLAKMTRLVITTVGPFQLYGSDTFAACAMVHITWSGRPPTHPLLTT